MIGSQYFWIENKQTIPCNFTARYILGIMHMKCSPSVRPQGQLSLIVFSRRFTVRVSYCNINQGIHDEGEKVFNECFIPPTHFWIFFPSRSTAFSLSVGYFVKLSMNHQAGIPKFQSLVVFVTLYCNSSPLSISSVSLCTTSFFLCLTL